jgi:hypothetical protein
MENQFCDVMNTKKTFTVHWLGLKLLGHGAYPQAAERRDTNPFAKGIKPI